MPISRFDFHFKNDFDVKIDLWDQLDAVMDIRSEYLRRMDVLVGLNQS
jgi:hypothetical protein